MIKYALWLVCMSLVSLSGTTLSCAQAAKDAVATPPPQEIKNLEKSNRLLTAIEALLKQAAEARGDAKDLPSREKFVFPPLWTETREDREQIIRPLLDAALEIVSDAPVVVFQAEIKQKRRAIGDLKDSISSLRERRLQAPESGFLPGVVTDTQRSIDADIVALEQTIKIHEASIEAIREKVRAGLAASGVTISKEQLNLLLDSVLGSDLLRLVTAFEASRGVDQRLGELLSQSGGDLKAARRYFAMHAALFAMLLQAQTIVLEKIDGDYMVKLNDVLSGIKSAREKSYQLLGGQNRPDQRRALEANVKSQNLAEKVASFYKDYLQTQRRSIAEARDRTIHDLEIADNTYETVEASFELRALMDDARTSFEALLRLEAPGFDQVFQNESLRKEFENLTEKLGPSS